MGKYPSPGLFEKELGISRATLYRYVKETKPPV